jgi:ribosomal protein S27AE
MNDDAASMDRAESTTSQEFPNQFCPVCSSRLESHRCKMICQRCGYFMSCSEFE